MKEQWIAWEPIKGLSPFYFIKSFFDNGSQLEIIFVDDSNQQSSLQMLFEGPILEYQWVDEYFWLEESIKVEQLYRSAFEKQRSFFKIVNSSYIQEAYLPQKNNRQLHHFVIIEEDYKIDIISSTQPQVLLLSNHS